MRLIRICVGSIRRTSRKNPGATDLFELSLILLFLSESFSATETCFTEVFPPRNIVASVAASFAYVCTYFDCFDVFRL